jgi:hypothetical protein
VTRRLLFGAAVSASLLAVTSCDPSNNVGHDNTPEHDFAKRVDSDVVVWVKASNADLRKCLLDSTTYSAGRDQQDTG